MDALLAHPDIDAVLNLTIPQAHAEVALRALDAGKHVYGEKPLALTTAEAAPILERAKALGLRVGAPRTPCSARDPDRPRAARRGPDRRPRRRIRRLECSRSRAVARRPRVLLPAGRRPAVRHGPLLPDQSGHVLRPGGARLGRDQPLVARAHGRHRPAGGDDDPGRCGHARHGDPGARLRRHLHGHGLVRGVGDAVPKFEVYGTAAPSPCPTRTCSRTPSSSRPPTTGSSARCRWPRATRTRAGVRAGRHGARHRDRSSAPRLRRAGVPRARDHGGRDARGEEHAVVELSSSVERPGAGAARRASRILVTSGPLAGR